MDNQLCMFLCETYRTLYKIFFEKRVLLCFSLTPKYFGQKSEDEYNKAKVHDNITPALPVSWSFYAGHLRTLLTQIDKNLYETCAEYMTKDCQNLRLVSFSIPLQNFVVITDPKYVDFLFTQKFDSIIKSSLFNERFEPMLGNVMLFFNFVLLKLFLITQQKKKKGLKGLFFFLCIKKKKKKRKMKHRQIASKIFTVRSLKDHMFKCFMATTDEFLLKMEELRCDEASELRSVNISDMFARLTLEAFTYIAFGVKVDCIATAPKVLEFPQAFDGAFACLAYRLLDPFYLVKKWLNVGKEKELKKHIQIVNDFAYNIIQKRTQVRSLFNNNNNNN
ncbi:electron carrier protein, partial [Reticulomyxa filosa]